MDFEEFKEQFAEDVKNDLEGKGIDASVKVNSVEKMNENYDALTVTPEGSNVGVNLNIRTKETGSISKSFLITT